MANYITIEHATNIGMQKCMQDGDTISVLLIKINSPMLTQYDYSDHLLNIW